MKQWSAQAFFITRCNPFTNKLMVGKIYLPRVTTCHGIQSEAGFILPRATRGVTGVHGCQHAACKKVSKAPPFSLTLRCTKVLVNTLADSLGEALQNGERNMELSLAFPKFSGVGTRIMKLDIFTSGTVSS